MPTIDDLSALEILDSRGRPTVCGACRLGQRSYGQRLGAQRGLDRRR